MPIGDARLMHAACKAQHPLGPCWVDGGEHNGIESEFAETTTAVHAFLEHLLANAPPPTAAPPPTVASPPASAAPKAKSQSC